MEVDLFVQSKDGQWGENINAIIKDFRWTSAFVPLVGDSLFICLEDYELRIELQQEDISGVVIEREFWPSSNSLKITLEIDVPSANEIRQELNNRNR